MARAKVPMQPPAGRNPFSDDHYQLANTMLAAHAQASEMYSRLARAGFNVQDLQTEIDQHAALARGVKQEFFPHLP